MAKILKGKVISVCWLVGCENMFANIATYGLEAYMKKKNSFHNRVMILITPGFIIFN